MRYLLSIFFLFFCLSAFSQVDRIELGYQSTKRGIEWTRPGLPTHVPVFRISRDTNTIIWHDKNTGMRYDWDYLTSVWYARGRFSSALPPLPTQTSGLATIDNRTGFYLNASNILHRYDITQTAWVPLKMTYQSAAPTNVAAGGGNGAAIYTTTLWQDSDDFLIRFWDGDSWELIGAGTDLTFSGASSPVTLNSSTGTDVTFTAGGINTFSATGTNITITATEVGTVASVGLALPTSVFDVSGSPVTSTGTLTATFDNQSANTVFAGPATGGAATPTFRTLVAADITTGGGVIGTGVVNQIPYFFPNTTTLTTESGSGANSLYWNPTTNKMSIGSSGGAGVLNVEFPGGIAFDKVIEFTNAGGWGNNWIKNFATSGSRRGIAIGGQNNAGADVDNVLVVAPYPQGRVAINKDPTTGLNYSFEVAGSTDTDGLVVSRSGSATDAAMLSINSDGDGILRTKSGNWTLGDLDVTVGFQNPNTILHLYGPTGATIDPFFRMEKSGGFGAILMELGYSGGETFGYLGNGTTRIVTLRSDNAQTTTRVGINQTSPVQTMHVQGTARITGSDGTATTIMGRDGDGDVSALSLSGMSISSGTLTATDGSTTNELQTLAHTSNSTSHTATLSNSGGSLQIIEGAGVLLTTGGTGLNGTVSIEAIDPSTTNEIQTYSASGAGPTSYDMTVSSGGTVTLAEGTGIDLTRSGNTITVASTAASAWLLDGNTITSAKRIGSNDNFDVVVETNGTDRMWFDNGGTVSIGATQLTTAALNINGLQGGIGQLIAGGSGLTAPNFYQATGSGSGSTATVFSGVISMLNGNVESLIQNTSTSGTGGVVMQLNAKTATGDPRLYMTIDGTTDWSIGIDNDDVDNLKLHRFAAPSDNNGEGTIEFGYDGTMIGMGINKTGIGTATNGYYALDIFGKTRADQFVNNRYDITSTPVATMAVGTAAGTSPTVDNTVTSVWGNAARLKFTSGSSPTANGVVCTITLGTEYTFNECIPIMQGRSTNAGAFNYSCSYDSGTRVITCTLVGTLTASTVYEFNIIFLGRN